MQTKIGTIFAILLFFSTFARASTTIFSPSHAVVCQALLTTLDWSNPELSKGNPVLSLRDFRAKVEKAGGKKSTLRDLAELEKETTGNSRMLQYFGVELRGTDTIAKYVDKSEREAHELNDKVMAEVKDKYPASRPGNAVHYGQQGLIALVAWLGIQSPDLFSQILFPGTMAIMAATFEFIHWKIPSLIHQQRSFDQQIATVRSCLSSGCPNDTVSIVSGHASTPTPFHNILMSRNPDVRPTLPQTVDASRGALETPYDGIARDFVDSFIRNYKDKRARGPLKEIYYDSLFYIDSDTGEPVWLIYYRAFNSSSEGFPIK
jgi:hypothetical protein